MSPDDIKHFLVIYDTTTGDVEVEECGTDYEAAQDSYAAAETSHDSERFDVVLLSADSLETIKQTHSSYFKGESEAEKLKLKLPG